jgi:hypothetical protein
LSRKLVLLPEQSHPVQIGQAFAGGFVARTAQHLDLGQRQVVADRQMGEQFEVLKHHAYAGAQLRQVGLGIVGGNVVDPDAAALNGFQAIHGLDQRGFAGA